jgi:hypothetical protein
MFAAPSPAIVFVPVPVATTGWRRCAGDFKKPLPARDPSRRPFWDREPVRFDRSAVRRDVARVLSETRKARDDLLEQARAMVLVA